MVLVLVPSYIRAKVGAADGEALALVGVLVGVLVGALVGAAVIALGCQYRCMLEPIPQLTVRLEVP